jgi:very-short-patch-repair endonuclease
MQKRAKLPNGYWNNPEHCKAEALKYHSRSEWQKGSPLSYRWAIQNNWIEECATHMRSKRMPDGYWTLERCQNEAKKYKSKVQWRMEHRASFSKANKEQWLVQCCGHMETSGMWFGPASILEALLSHSVRYEMEYRFKDGTEIDRRPFDFYLPDFNLVIEFHGEQHLTGWGRKDLDAQGIQARDLFKKTWAKDHGINYLEIKQWEIRSKEEILDRVIKELQLVSKKNKIDIPLIRRDLTKSELLKVKSRLKWTKDACIAEAKKYKTIKEWQISSPSSYQAAFKKDWLVDCSDHIDRLLHKKNHWTLTSCFEEAQQYKTKSAWQQAKRSGYSIAAKNGWIEKCTSHMEPDGRKIVGQRLWTKEKCLELAKACNSRAEFKKASGSAYLRARVKGWLEECCGHMKQPLIL